MVFGGNYARYILMAPVRTRRKKVQVIKTWARPSWATDLQMNFEKGGRRALKSKLQNGHFHIITSTIHFFKMQKNAEF